MKSSFIFRTLVAILVIAGSLIGCDVQTYDEAASRVGTTPPPAPPPPPPPPPAFGPNFSEIQTNVFDVSCTGCHGGANPSEGLNLEAANSYMELVGITSSQDPNFMRVTALQPGNSYLIQKLEGTGLNPSVMPPAGLPQTTINIIRDWITAGAVDDRPPPPVAAPVKVLSISIPPNAMLQTPPASIIAGFTRDLNTATISAASFLLEASGASDGTFNDGNEIPIAATVINTPTSSSAVFDLNGVNLPNETYQITLVGTGVAAIMDLTPNALDGEFLGGLPSGDDTAGGDFVIQFSIAVPAAASTLPDIQAAVFGPRCSGCHNGVTPTPPVVLDLSGEQLSFDNLVNIASMEPGGGAVLRVNPGQSGDSYLIQKLEGTHLIGVQMPPGVPLTQPVIDGIRLWIDNGAPRN